MSEMGRLIQRTMGGWLEQIDNETRRSLTDTVFALLEATGQDTFDSISEQKWKSAAAMITSMAGLPREKRLELLRLAGKLIQSGGLVSRHPTASCETPENVESSKQGERYQDNESKNSSPYDSILGALFILNTHDQAEEAYLPADPDRVVSEGLNYVRLMLPYNDWPVKTASHYTP